MSSKTCTVCRAVKPLTEFYKDASRKDGLRSDCRPCGLRNTAEWKKANPDLRRESTRRTNLKRYYGITPETYETMLTSQGGDCAICGGTCRRRLAVDHCHTTGAIRGLLCDPCNRGLGNFHDNPAALRSAAVYLESAANQPPKGEFP